ncbi:MAG: hypothetical protein SGPRY_012803, partial [Prymnesium sp.]
MPVNSTLLAEPGYSQVLNAVRCAEEGHPPSGVQLPEHALLPSLKVPVPPPVGGEPARRDTPSDEEGVECGPSTTAGRSAAQLSLGEREAAMRMIESRDTPPSCEAARAAESRTEETAGVCQSAQRAASNEQGQKVLVVFAGASRVGDLGGAFRELGCE